VGVLKLALGKKVWSTWEELDLGMPSRGKQRYYTEAELQRIIDASEGQYKVLASLLAGTGVRIGEAAGLNVEDVDLQNQIVHVRRSVFEGKEVTTKTIAGVRDIDIDLSLNRVLTEFIGDRTEGPLFRSKRGTRLAHGNLRTRWLHPLLKKLGIPRGGLHSFRHARVTALRKAGVPEDLQKLWIGHSSLATGDRYNHASEELEYRRAALSSEGLDRVVGTIGPTQPSSLPSKKAS
jgi:integrase